MPRTRLEPNHRRSRLAPSSLRDAKRRLGSVVGLVVVSLLGLLAVVACGQAGPPSGLRELTIEVALPPGAGTGAAVIATPYGARPLVGSSGKVSVGEQGAVLASVERGGTTLLMGFVSPDRTRLDVRTTAEVLAFYHLRGPFLEPAMQEGLIDFLAWSAVIDPVVTAVGGAVVAADPQVGVDNPAIADALAAMFLALAPEGDDLASPLNLTISPDHQTSGIEVRETAPLVDVLNVYNAFRRPVHVFVERTSPTTGAVDNFPLEGAAIEQPSTARTFQELTGYARGEVPRSAVRSHDVAVPGTEDGQTVIYTVTVVGAGGDLLPSTLPSQQAQTARELALRTAIERFLAPTVGSALEAGGPQRVAADFGPILDLLSEETIRQIEQGDFARGIDAAFAELFNSAAMPNTIGRILSAYYPDLLFTDSVQEVVRRLSRNLSRLVGATASSVSSNGSGIISTIQRSKRVETFIILAKPISLRLTPAQSTIGTGGEVVLSAAIHFPEGVTGDDVSFRYSIEGALAGYASDGGVDKAFPFTTDSTVISYKHRDTINIAYGSDTVTVEALQVQEGIATVVATGSATVTVRESTISLSPRNVEMGFGEEQAFTATVEPMPESGTLSYVFVTYGASTFVGGAQTSVGGSDRVVFRQSNTEEGAQQPVTVTVVLVHDDGEQTVLGQAQASTTLVERTGYTIAGTPDGQGNWVVDDALDVSLNGQQIYSDGMARAGSRSPFTFDAQRGDTLTFTVRDHVGVCSDMTPLYLVKGTRSVLADPGFDLGCGRPVGDQGVVHTHTFTIPW